MKIAIFGDLHAHDEMIEPLSKAMQSCERWFCLGDFASGSGAGPAVCFDWVFSSCEIILRGNHEQFVLDKVWQGGIDADWAFDAARAYNLLGKERLSPLNDLESHALSDEIELVHGSLTGPTHDFLSSEEQARRNINLMRWSYLAFGHTHSPAYWQNNQKMPMKLNQPRELQKGALINPGAAKHGRWLEINDGYAIWRKV
jgi:predicted phosphodiesterase